ncbi:hypothetical protein C8R45DRAFT_1157109 [Mycena sanguinolenta]|nr:hypothetical protein C8R45DRAFT_1157109 [Mycena sanguinolenta]
MPIPRFPLPLEPRGSLQPEPLPFLCTRADDLEHIIVLAPAGLEEVSTMRARDGVTARMRLPGCGRVAAAGFKIGEFGRGFRARARAPRAPAAASAAPALRTPEGRRPPCPPRVPPSAAAFAQDRGRVGDATYRASFRHHWANDGVGMRETDETEERGREGRAEEASGGGRGRVEDGRWKRRGGRRRTSGDAAAVRAHSWVHGVFVHVLRCFARTGRDSEDDVLSATSRVRSCSRSKNAAGTPFPAARDSMPVQSRVTCLFDYRTYAVLAVAFRCPNSLLEDLKPLLFGQEKDVPHAVSPVCVYIKKDDCCTNAPRPPTPASPPSNTLLYTIDDMYKQTKFYTPILVIFNSKSQSPCAYSFVETTAQSTRKNTQSHAEAPNTSSAVSMKSFPLRAETLRRFDSQQRVCPIDHPRRARVRAHG